MGLRKKSRNHKNSFAWTGKKGEKEIMDMYGHFHGVEN